MIYDCCYKVIENKSNITYSYDNTERIITKSDVSNITSIKVCNAYSYKTYLNNILNIRKLCINGCSPLKINVKCVIEIKDYYIQDFNGNRNLVVDFELYTRVDNMNRCNRSISYCKNYQYAIPIDNYDLDNISVNINDIDFEILKNEKIKVYTFIEFKF